MAIMLSMKNESVLDDIGKANKVGKLALLDVLFTQIQRGELVFRGERWQSAPTSEIFQAKSFDFDTLYETNKLLNVQEKCCKLEKEGEKYTIVVGDFFPVDMLPFYVMTELRRRAAKYKAEILEGLLNG